VYGESGIRVMVLVKRVIGGGVVLGVRYTICVVTTVGAGPPTPTLNMVVKVRVTTAPFPLSTAWSALPTATHCEYQMLFESVEGQCRSMVLPIFLGTGKNLPILVEIEQSSACTYFPSFLQYAPVGQATGPDQF